jgi:hypothetical protein
MYEKAIINTPGVPATSISTFKPCPVPEFKKHFMMVSEFMKVTLPQTVLPIFAVTAAKEPPMLEPKTDMVADPIWNEAAKFGLIDNNTGDAYENAAALERI